MEFQVPCVPVAQPRQRHRIIGKHVMNYTSKTHPVNAFKAAVGVAWLSAGGDTVHGPIHLQASFVMPRPQNMTRKTKPNPRCLHAKKPDLDNLLKSLKDALTLCGAWRDDSQVASVYAIKSYAAGGEAPHVEVVIEPASDIVPQPQ